MSIDQYLPQQCTGSCSYGGNSNNYETSYKSSMPKTENFGLLGALIIGGVGFGLGYLAKGSGGHGRH
ncbi:MAG TPA: hypothetical protein VI564_01890 [Candidatus Nanoarchaeia archaeon]|nr:hypothetical protein [Candidatus Nanoarchaeia archaeon]